MAVGKATRSSLEITELSEALGCEFEKYLNINDASFGNKVDSESEVYIGQRGIGEHSEKRNGMKRDGTLEEPSFNRVVDKVMDDHPESALRRMEFLAKASKRTRRKILRYKANPLKRTTGGSK